MKVSEREYYSVRTGKNPAGKQLDLEMLRRLVKVLFDDFEDRGYFQQSFGYYCFDAGDVPGTVGKDVDAYILRKVRKHDLWPISSHIDLYSEDDLFDMMEFLYDHVSKPLHGWYHSYGNCGWHYTEFDKEEGQEEFRAELNQLIQDYGDGYQLTSQGEILSLGEPGMLHLLEAELPHYDPQNVEGRVEKAILKFRYRRASVDDRREAVRILADVLEFMRPMVKDVLATKDERDLFEIANNFGIRHHRQGQKTGYDQSIWLSWIFYFYLATIHTVVRLINIKQKSGL